MTTFEDVYALVGEFGLYQALTACVLTIPGCFMNSFGVFSFVFLSFTPDFQCKSNQSIGFNNDSILIDSFNSTQEIQYTYQECSININQSSITKDQNIDHQIQCINGWEYDQSIMQTSWITRWDLVCDRAALPKIALSIFSVCSLIGCCVFAWQQDRFGRKITSFTCTCFYLAGVLLTLVTPDFLSTMAALCLCAFQGISSWNANYVLAMELIGNERRINVMLIFCTAYSVGSVLIGGVAYALRNYWGIQLAISIPFLTMLPAYLFIDESPRWLWANDRLEESSRILERIGRFSHRSVTRDDIMAVLMKAKQADKKEQEINARESEFAKKANVLDLFRGPQLRAKLFLVTISWFANALVYYGIAYNSENINVNFFLIYMLQALVEIPTSILNLYLLKIVGRILPLCGGLLLAGVCCFGTAIPGLSQWLTILLVMASKFGVCISYGVSYQIACELFPTKLRGTATGFCSVLGEAGNMIMPYVILSALVDKSLPMVILGSFALVGSFSALFLPETKGKQMPDLLDEAETDMIAGRSAFWANLRRRNMVDCISSS